MKKQNVIYRRLGLAGIALTAWVLGAGISMLQAAEAEAPAADPDAAQVAEKKPAWEKSVSLGLTVTDGNSDTVLATANILAATKWNRNELALGASGAYGEADGEKNNEIGRIFGQYNRLFTERFYGYARADLLHDDIADVDYRVSLSPGVGYYFIKTPRTFLRGEFGPGYIFQRQGGDTDNYMTLRFAEAFEHKFSDKAKLWQSVEFLPEIDDWNNFILNAEVGVETLLTKLVSLQVVFQDTFNNRPAPDREKNDMKLVAGLKVTF